ncbi:MULTISPECIES: TetR/AcrR family transcriptional regulator [Mycobacteriaceae]|uniref:TetR/AcrR family transcriptional regulator n=1 Tax=Mycobacteriaceae TaxID=1762 RepID=UPI0007FC0F6F|nr:MULTISPECIES: TetR/AcrR family transcriptional regulator [Mycobacteriaceae]MCK0175641.1 TetR/AcrR family transcriptional regulator [Mycolicibacterium sp. F2034L]OBB58665.1 TetR family transcriptional regulator [Mycobacterium sp. 852013-51886_SCH5428379]
MARTSPAGGDGVRRRPRDRKAQIARASAEAFSTLGYHGVSMEAIASRVGISAAALYRHYTGKYELFRDAVLSLGQQLVDATAFADDADGDPREVLLALAAALSDTALNNRESGGLYRWEARYLRGDDQATLNAQLRAVHRRIQGPLCALRPDLDSRDRWTLSTAMMSVLGSVVDHRAKLPGGQIRALLSDLVLTLVPADFPDLPDEAEPVAATPLAHRSKYEALLVESMKLFNQKGYRDTSMEDIAAAVGMPASGIYRYFSGKSDILAGGFRRDADRWSAEMTAILDQSTDREEALTRLIDGHVARSFGQPEMDYVYYTERLNMSAGDQQILRNLQRSTVETWGELVAALRPEWTAGQARFAVYAAMAVVVDLGRLVQYRNSPYTRALVSGLMDLTLLGRYRLRTVLPAK